MLRKVFPDHWSFMMGEIALYAFVVLVLTGVYLTSSSTPARRRRYTAATTEPSTGSR